MNAVRFARILYDAHGPPGRQLIQKRHGFGFRFGRPCREENSLGEGHGSAADVILCVQPGAVVGQNLYDRLDSAIGGGVHGGQSEGIGGVHIGAMLQAELDGFGILGVAVAIGLRGDPIHARGSHQRGGSESGRDVGIGSVFEQDTHQFHVSR